jgi:hypothetical protein
MKLLVVTNIPYGGRRSCIRPGLLNRQALEDLKEAIVEEARFVSISFEASRALNSRKMRIELSFVIGTS